MRQQDDIGRLRQFFIRTFAFKDVETGAGNFAALYEVRQSRFIDNFAA